MNKAKGFITLDRKILDWEWADDSSVFSFFVKLILAANHQDNKWHGIVIKRGSIIGSTESLCECKKKKKTTFKRCRKILEDCGAIKVKVKNNCYQVITIVHYDKYQSLSEVGRKTTDRTTDKPTKRTTNRAAKKTTDKAADTPTTIEQDISIPKGIDISGKKEKNASSARLGGGELTAEKRKQILDGIIWRSRESFEDDTKDICWGDLPNYAPVRNFSRAMNGDDYSAGTFYNAFKDSKTLLPCNWRDIYYRFYHSEPECQQQFLTALSNGEYRERWGTAP